jgi:hypothetical protein
LTHRPISFDPFVHHFPGGQEESYVDVCQKKLKEMLAEQATPNKKPAQPITTYAFLNPLLTPSLYRFSGGQEEGPGDARQEAEGDDLRTGEGRQEGRSGCNSGGCHPRPL